LEAAAQRHDLARARREAVGKRNFTARDTPPRPSSKGGLPPKSRPQTVFDGANPLKGREIPSLGNHCR
jgi:hypothetical protein